MVRFSPFISALFLAGILGYLVGRITAVQVQIHDVPPLHLQEESREGASVVHFDQIQDGMLRGSIQGDVRVFLGDDQILPKSEGQFSIEPSFFLKSDVTVLVPEGMQFVASKRGKKYYPVFSSQGQRIVVENRVYFENEKQAESAGYRR